MKKSLFLLLTMLFALSTQVWAGKDDQVIIQEAQKNNITVAQALRANDETAVTLTGTIVSQIQHEHYEFKDQTGTINIEVDEDIANANTLKAGTKVKNIRLRPHSDHNIDCKIDGFGSMALKSEFVKKA